ncbi:folylpolyglutamate synthase/dihydrofolate synthase family protein [Microbacterium aquimaris]|uniref:bifunctional folylpolyglutamate synthase/dihydrofolate synthase n=1 Tax=Microbacterium aquimaris TaxID=459816 RepID=UPI002AD24595|nr:folylpolyglutamate synthase/dihydrofolate synthase family protein [Microbacterium aquimaris]MDZ8275893.1 folylpolyglutamate synthase/dihydrofolate synthase family protein [Microbacterium aquimaris]
MSDREKADAVYAALLERAGERWVQPRIDRTQRVLDLLDDPQRTYRVVHITGTNGKTSTARVVDALVRAHGLRTGVFTSPHLERFTERILIDGEPIDDAAVVSAWEEITPFVGMIDAELEADGQDPLTFFELLTVLAFVAFADAPVDVAVVEVGMGGSWDSTNTADGDVAVVAPVGIDHADRLGRTPAEIATVKAGIIKDGALVVSARQEPEVEAVLRATANERGATIAFEGRDFGLTDARLAVGGQQLTVQGLAGRYDEAYLPVYGSHQGRNATLAIAAVEMLLGAGERAIAPEVLTEALTVVSTPGRLQLLGTDPTVFVDAAHNPHGAAALATALRESFAFEEWGLVLGVLGDKDAAGIVAALAPVATRVFVTAPDSERAGDPDALADLVEAVGLDVTVHGDLAAASEEARAWAGESSERAVVIAGSVVLAGEAIALSVEEGWKSGAVDD